ncbi:YwnB [Streptococcus pneumoniae]|nr:YwnB [Streptococcus pneumoniae]CRC75896.1 YwnB [Streptococcus pneumoniae]VMK54434.1 YwnB [Streptococcus pneumoniae]VMY03690.1 YwnB [Streptococcus pneumoniae]VNB52921.1 YwnB [Streptococcus pneumoniae]
MKLAVIAANGQAGKAIVEEAVKRGHEVTAIVRSENKSQAESIIKKDLFELTKDDLTGFDAVISALVLIHQIRYRSTANQSNYLISFLLEHRHVF